MSEGETVNEDQTANESQGQTAGGSGGSVSSPEKVVADYVEDLRRHIASNGYDMLADVALLSLTAGDSVPVDAYLHSVKTAWCLHRAAVHYVRQYSVERAAADRARGDAQFERSHRVQAEHKAEKLEAELAQSVLLVENQRLRMEEMEQQQREVRQQMLETAEAALLEQQQRNEQLVTHNSQQLIKISELQTQVEFLKVRLTEEKAVTTKRLEQIQELRSEVSHVQRLWGESRRRVEELEQQVQEKQEPAIPAAGGLLRDVSHYTEMAETDTPDSDVSAEPPAQMRAGRWRTRGGEVRNVTPTPTEDERAVRYSWYDAQYDQTWLPSGHYHIDGESPLDLLDYLGPIEAEPEPQPVHLQAMIEAQAETIARLHSELSNLHSAATAKPVDGSEQIAS